MEEQQRLKVRQVLRDPIYNDPTQLQHTELFRQWWYYTVELLPGVVAKGQYEDDFPMLPRMMLRNIDLEGSVCLDLGTMEGLIPVLMRKGGAAAVLATDFSDHCAEKMEMVKHFHGVEFDYGSIGLMYGLSHTIPDVGFDVINCSGLLYHVFSPLMVLCGMRPLLKRNGLAIVSTNVVFDDAPVMHFNHGGRMQPEVNTFWYPTVGLLDYLLRYLRLQPVDAMYMPHDQINTRLSYRFEQPSGYVSVLCRATDEVNGDPWLRESARLSWEYNGLVDWGRANAQPWSHVRPRGADQPIDLVQEVQRSQVRSPAAVDDSHVLRLGAVA